MTYDVAIVGAGPGGYVAAIRAAQLGMRVICIDKEKALGGTCLNVGCIPSKTLLHATELLSRVKQQGPTFGIQANALSCNLSQLMEKKRKVISNFNEGISALFKKNQITFLCGEAKLASPESLLVGQQTIQAKQIILAPGSQPIALPFLPFDEERILSSTGALALDTVPRTLLVVGAGVIGVELGSVYSRLGSKVVFVEFLDRICPTLDESLSKALQESLTAQGMMFQLSSKVTGAELSPGNVTLTVGEQKLQGDAVLVSIGRRAYTQNLGLEKVGIALTPKGLIPVDGHFRTTIPNIFAIGDVIDGPMLAHKASEEGIAVAEIIAGQAPTIEYLAIPSIVYTDPECASVGWTEQEVKQLGVSYRVGQFPFKANSRAKSSAEEEGFVKLIAEEKSDRLIGAHIIGSHASELIASCALAIQNRLTSLEVVHTPFAHPTLSEAIKEAALAVHKRAIHR